MPEITLFKSEEVKSRSEIAEFIRRLADKLEGDGEITLKSGAGESLALSVPENPTLEVKAEEETRAGGGKVKRKLEIELEWIEGEEGKSGGVTLE